MAQTATLPAPGQAATLPAFHVTLPIPIAKLQSQGATVPGQEASAPPADQIPTLMIS